MLKRARLMCVLRRVYIFLFGGPPRSPLLPCCRRCFVKQKLMLRTTLQTSRGRNTLFDYTTSRTHKQQDHKAPTHAKKIELVGLHQHCWLLLSQKKKQKPTTMAAPAAPQMPAAVAFQSPKYIQVAHALKRLGAFVRETFPDAAGRRAGLLTSARLRARYAEDIIEGLQQQEQQHQGSSAPPSPSPLIVEFAGECSRANVARYVERMRAGAGNGDSSDSSSVGFLIGFGGGKLLDVAKLVAHELRVPVVIVPSLASTDAPCTALSVVYSDAGVFESVVYYPQSPALVVVDTAVIAEAPREFLVAGMGDALATHYEARAVARNPAAFTKIAPLGYRPPRIAAAIAGECARLLFEHGAAAAADCAAGRVSEALEAVVEANILLSGLGVECGGLAVAHGLHNALTVFPEVHGRMHGEKVAFGTLVQLVLEGDAAEAARVAAFNAAVGLPLCLADLGLPELDETRLATLAAKCLEKGNLCNNMGPALTAGAVAAAIREADAMGRALKQQQQQQ